MSLDNHVPSILNPYRDTALLYREKWFKGMLILPYKEKEVPPSDFTGKRAPYPSLDQINVWINDGIKHNICIRLAGVDEEYELIGIDVDDYMKGDKKKNGGDQLSNLEKHLCVLPETWISTARLDGVSGIRIFRVPRGLVYRGKADKDIEIIQKGHRYTLVWPSVHPEGGIYWWYPPGVRPDKEGKKVWDGVLPDARTIPILPDPWIDYLSHNRLIMPEDGLIDMDSTVDEVYAWATDTFYGDGINGVVDGTDKDDSAMCSKMQEKLNKHLKKIESSSTFHDLLTNAHWNLLHLAFEGHVGWNAALREMENEWCNAVARRGGTTVRDVSTMGGEVFRSRIQALRQIKAKSDERVVIRADALDPCCLKTGMCGIAGGIVGGVAAPDPKASDNNLLVPGLGGQDDGSGSSGDGGDPLGDIPGGAMKGVPEYETNDDGNAQHFLDMFSTVSTGRSLRWAKNYGWIVWHKGNPEGVGEKQPHWERDMDGDQEIRRMWHKVKERQQAYAEACHADWLNKIEDLARGLNNVTDIDVKIAKAVYDKWKKFSESSGNNRNAENAVKAARAMPGVAIDMDLLDSNPYLLGVANGVVELDRENVRLRRADINDYLTLNTGVPWEEPSNNAKNIWNDYLNTFLPDLELQKAVQVAFGYCLMGGNPEKKIIILKGDTNTGKSTFINAIKAALGDYAQTVNQSVFQNHKLNPVLGNALTKRLIVCSEFDEKDQLSASQVKRLTGATDGLQVEMKNQNETLEKEAQFVAALATNEVPGISGADKALENRLMVIPFNVTPSKIKRGQDNAIIASAKTAILAWLVEGFIEYRRQDGLITTKQMEETKKQFVSELDEIANFTHECVAEATSPQQYISRSAMYDRFKIWWMENNFQERDRPSQPKFTRRMNALGFKTRGTRFRVNGEPNHWWIGVKFEKKESNVISMTKLVSVISETDNESETPKNSL